MPTRHQKVQTCGCHCWLSIVATRRRFSLRRNSLRSSPCPEGSSSPSAASLLPESTNCCIDAFVGPRRMAVTGPAASVNTDAMPKSKRAFEPGAAKYARYPAAAELMGRVMIISLYGATVSCQCRCRNPLGTFACLKNADHSEAFCSASGLC